MRGRGRAWLGLALLAALMFFTNLGARDLWEPDEPNFALTSREMLETGDTVLLQMNGQPMGEKPPMFFWSVALFSKAFGGQVTEWTTRLPSAIAMFIVTLATAAVGARFFGRRAGLLAGAILATTHLGVWEARVGQVDATNALYATLTFLYLLLAMETEWPSVTRLIIAYGFAGLTILAKGPAGMIVALLTAVLTMALTRGRRGVRDLRLELGVPIVLLFTALWLYPLSLRAPEGFLKYLVYKQTVTRYLNPWHHEQPAWYYLKTLPLDFLPWSLFLPGAFLLAWREGWVRRDPPSLFVFLWPLVVLAFFSISTGKRSVYMLPAIPGLALLTGRFLDTALERTKEWRRWVLVPAWLWCAALAGVAIAAPRILIAKYPLMSGTAFALAPLGLASATALALALWRGRVGEALGCYLMGAAAFLFYLHTVMLPAFDPYASAKPFCRKLVEELRPGEQPISYGFFRGTYGFYSRRKFVRADDPESLAAFIRFHPDNLAILQVEDLAEIQKDGRFGLDILDRRDIGNRKMVMARIGKRESTRWRTPGGGS